jgi:hypothetical protein
MIDMETAKQSVVTVGQGRGFVIEGAKDRLIITAAHCLPFFPPCMSASDLSERTYGNIIAPLGSSPAVGAECLFVDPIGDIGPPDNQALSTEFDDYQELVQVTVALKISSPARSGPAWLLSLENRWFRCAVRQVGGPLWIFGASESIMGGMSGSPIITDDGSAIGVLCTSSGMVGQIHTDGGPNPRMDGNLPAWVLRDLNWEMSAPA